MDADSRSQQIEDAYLNAEFGADREEERKTARSVFEALFQAPVRITFGDEPIPAGKEG